MTERSAAARVYDFASELLRVTPSNVYRESFLWNTLITLLLLEITIILVIIFDSVTCAPWASPVGVLEEPILNATLTNLTTAINTTANNVYDGAPYAFYNQEFINVNCEFEFKSGFAPYTITFILYCFVMGYMMSNNSSRLHEIYVRIHAIHQSPIDGRSAEVKGSRAFLIQELELKLGRYLRFKIISFFVFLLGYIVTYILRASYISFKAGPGAKVGLSSIDSVSPLYYFQCGNETATNYHWQDADRRTTYRCVFDSINSLNNLDAIQLVIRIVSLVAMLSSIRDLYKYKKHHDLSRAVVVQQEENYGLFSFLRSNLSGGWMDQQAQQLRQRFRKHGNHSSAEYSDGGVDADNDDRPTVRTNRDGQDVEGMANEGTRNRRGGGGATTRAGSNGAATNNDNGTMNNSNPNGGAAMMHQVGAGLATAVSHFAQNMEQHMHQHGQPGGGQGHRRQPSQHSARGMAYPQDYKDGGYYEQQSPYPSMRSMISDAFEAGLRAAHRPSGPPPESYYYRGGDNTGHWGPHTFADRWDGSVRGPPPGMDPYAGDMRGSRAGSVMAANNPLYEGRGGSDRSERGSEREASFYADGRSPPPPPQQNNAHYRSDSVSSRAPPPQTQVEPVSARGAPALLPPLQTSAGTSPALRGQNSSPRLTTSRSTSRDAASLNLTVPTTTATTLTASAAPTAPSTPNLVAMERLNLRGGSRADRAAGVGRSGGGGGRTRDGGEDADDTARDEWSSTSSDSAELRVGDAAQFYDAVDDRRL